MPSDYGHAVRKKGVLAPQCQNTSEAGIGRVQKPLELWICIRLPQPRRLKRNGLPPFTMIIEALWIRQSPTISNKIQSDPLQPHRFHYLQECRAPDSAVGSNVTKNHCRLERTIRAAQVPGRLIETDRTLCFWDT